MKYTSKTLYVKKRKLQFSAHIQGITEKVEIEFTMMWRPGLGSSLSMPWRIGRIARGKALFDMCQRFAYYTRERRGKRLKSLKPHSNSFPSWLVHIQNRFQINCFSFTACDKVDISYTDARPALWKGVKDYSFGVIYGISNTFNLAK